MHAAVQSSTNTLTRAIILFFLETDSDNSGMCSGRRSIQSRTAHLLSIRHESWEVFKASKLQLDTVYHNLNSQIPLTETAVNRKLP